jgi:hypothetical protein
MRALRRIATPASVAVALGGCSYPFEEYLPQKTDAGLTTNADAANKQPEEEEDARDSGAFEVSVEDTFVPDTFAAEDTKPPPEDACACTKLAGGKCREWSPPGCGD